MTYPSGVGDAISERDFSDMIDFAHDMLIFLATVTRKSGSTVNVGGRIVDANPLIRTVRCYVQPSVGITSGGDLPLRDVGDWFGYFPLGFDLNLEDRVAVKGMEFVVRKIELQTPVQRITMDEYINE